MIETPFLTVDGIVELYDAQARLKGIVVIERKNPPHGLALPGGFVDIAERVEAAVVREMKEEISLDVTVRHLQGVYSDPARDRRFHTVSCVFVCRASGAPRADDDAKSVRVVSPEALRELPFVFDHAEIVADYLAGKTGTY